MRPRPRRSSNAARSSSASGGCAIALSPTASRKLATACSPSHGCRQVSGEAREQRTRSSVCTKSSSGGSRRRPCCHRLIPQRCCSGRCSPLVRSTCARLMVGRRLPPSPSISRLTSRPDRVLSKCRRSRHPIPTPLATAPPRDRRGHDRRKGAEREAGGRRVQAPATGPPASPLLRKTPPERGLNLRRVSGAAELCDDAVSRRGAGEVSRPRIHQKAAAVKQVAAEIRARDLVANLVRQRHLGDLERNVRL